MKPKLAFAWFVVSLALTALLVVQWRDSTKQKQMLERVQLQIEKMDQQEKAAKLHIAELEKESRQLRGELRAAELEANSARMAYNAALQMTNAPAGQGQAATGQPQQGNGGMGNFLANMMKDPEMRKVMEQQQRMGLDMVYGSLFKQLQLAPDQENAFKDTLLGLQMTNMTQAGAMMDPGNTNRTEMVQKMAEDRKQVDEKLKELLGEEKFGQYEAYNQTLPERMMLDQFTKQTQVSPEQSEQLLAIMREEKRNMQINMGGETVDMSKDWQKLLESGESAEKMFAQQEKVNERVLERANEVLSPEQLEKFRPFVTNQTSMQRAGYKMARTMFQNSSSAPQPASPPQR